MTEHTEPQLPVLECDCDPNVSLCPDCQCGSLRDPIVMLEAALLHLHKVACEYGAGSELWNAVCHEDRAKRDGVWSPDVWEVVREY